MYHLYIIECADGSYYTGITTDVEKRFQQHREGRGARYTKMKGAVRVVYTEVHENKSLAMRRECEVKKLSRKQKVDLVTAHC